ncbi:unnamed protein product, partial [Oppiella nova]
YENNHEKHGLNLLKLIRKIGSGTFGIIYKAIDYKTRKLYTIKKAKINLKETFKEISILIKVESIYVVKYLCIWVIDTDICIQMQLCSTDLKSILDVKPQVFGRQSGQVMGLVEYFISCEIYRQILQCVQYLHELNAPVIHRHLKPDNILIARRVRKGRFIKLCDFELASMERVTNTKHTGLVGTLGYMAPESKLYRKYSTKSDVCSLAIIANEFSNLLDMYCGKNILDLNVIEY